jgi:hypothetical protein
MLIINDRYFANWSSLVTFRLSLYIYSVISAIFVILAIPDLKIRFILLFLEYRKIKKGSNLYMQLLSGSNMWYN